MVDILIISGVFILGILALGLIATRLYHRAIPGIALVRTGAGKAKCTTEGGLIIIPVLHELTKVNMETIGLEVSRQGNDALITGDHMRANASVKFFVRVDDDDESIKMAARTLKQRTFNKESLQSFVEDKLVDALRSVAAKMEMEDLHRDREDFVNQVQETVQDGLRKNGLMLEEVSLTSFDQTPFDALDTENIFNAQGMRDAVEKISNAATERATIEKNRDIKIAEEESTTAREIARIQREESEAKFLERQATEVAESLMATEIKQRQEADRKNAEVAATEARRDAEKAEIDKALALEQAKYAKKIALEEKSEEVSAAAAKAAEARRLMVEAEESVVTTQQVAEADRDKQIEIIKATERAEVQATDILVAAQAEKDAAANKAEALSVKADGESTFIIKVAEANKTKDLAAAEGKQALIEAENALAPEIIAYRLAQKRIEIAPEIIDSMVTPLESINGINVNYVGGIHGENHGGMTPAMIHDKDGNPIQSGGMSGSLVDQVFHSIGAFSVAGPTLAKLGKDIAGIDISNPESLNETIEKYVSGNTETDSLLDGLDEESLLSHKGTIDDFDKTHRNFIVDGDDSGLDTI